MLEVQDKELYLDSASTSKVRTEIIKDVNTLLEKYYGNADSLHEMGQRVSALVRSSRQAIAKMIGVLEHEVIYTSGASESNAAIIKGIAFSDQTKKHIITSNIEHSSIDETLSQMEEVFGYEVERLAVNEKGYVELEDLKKALRDDTILVAMMHVNNEIGSILPINDYASVIKKHSNAYFHVDAVQSFTKEELNLKQIDSISISAHKLGGLKGSGLLIKKDRVPFIPLIAGGQQEFGLRGGTLDTISAIVMAKTIRLSIEDNQKNYQKIKTMQNYLFDSFENVDGVIINTPKHSSPYIFNLSITNVGSEIMMNALNKEKIYVSARSTCHSESNSPSYVLKAIGRSDQEALSSIRISLSSELDLEDIKRVVKVIMETKDYVQY